MPTQRIIKSTFIGLNNEPLRNAVVQVIHMQGNTIDNIEYPQVTKNFVTNREGKINFTLWCNEEGERASFYRFILPGGETFDAIVPVGTSDLELSVLREGGGNSSDPQHQSLITYILSQAGINLATNTVAGRVRTNTNSNDPVVYLKSEVDTLIAGVSGADLANYYTKPQSDTLLNTKADKSNTYTKTQTDALIGGVTVDLSGYYTKTQTDGLVAPKANSSDVTAALLLKANTSDVNTSLAAKANSTDVYTKGQTDTLISGTIPTTAKGVALGVATLDSGAKIPDAQIPDAVTRDTELTAGLAAKADASTTYTKTETNTLLATKANQSTTYSKTEVDNLVAASDTLVELTDVAISSPSNTQVLAYNSTTSKWTNQTISGGGGGETNTASNVGVGGVGVFKQKTGVNLEFRNINAASTKVTVVSDAANNEIDIDVTEANLTLGNIGGTLPITKGGTGQITASAALTALGGATSTSLTTHTSDNSNPHATTAAQVGAIATTARGAANGVASLDASTLVPDAQLPTSVARTSDVTTSLALKANLASPTFTGTVAVPNQTAGDSSTKAANTAFVTTGLSTKADTTTVNSALALKADTTALTSHTSSTSNPHSVTAAQVGSATAQWNANKIQGVAISSTTPANNQTLIYNSTTSSYEPSNRIGDHPGYRSGLWYSAMSQTDGLAAITTASTANTISYHPFSITKPITISKMSINQATTATGLFRFGVYSNNSTTFLPETLLLQTIELNAAGTLERGDTVSYTFNPGWYWFAITSNVSLSISGETALASIIYYLGRVTFGITNLVYGYRNPLSYSSGSLPTTAPLDTLTEITAGLPFLFLKVA